VWFPDAAGHGLPIVLDAEIVRATVGPDPRDGVRIGCRLLRPPSAAERRLVGLAASHDRRRGFTPRGEHPPHALLFATAGTVLGPLCAVRLLAIDGRRLSLRVDDASPELAARFGSPAVRLGLPRGGRLAWDTPARLVEVRRDAAAPGSLAVEVEAELPVPRDVMRGFRRRGRPRVAAL
jgi:hypothetical protein